MKVVFAAVCFVMILVVLSNSGLKAQAAPADELSYEIDGDLYLAQSCQTRADCPSPQDLYECIHGRCMGVVMQKACVRDSDCPAYYVCVSGRCIGQ